jgi:hypothetical protein
VQALQDGEGSMLARLRARAHLRRCAPCAARHRQLTADIRQTHGLLAFEALRPDASDAWKRFLVRRGREALGVASRRSIGWSVLPPAAILVVACVAGVLLFRSPERDLVARMYSLSAQDRVAPKVPTRHDREFASSLTSLEAAGVLWRVSDVCCADRDGEGPADDGVLTVLLAGSRSPVVILYEDTQRAGRFQPGDVILMVSRPGRSAAAVDPRLHRS